jgi:hypothetical protein
MLLEKLITATGIGVGVAVVSAYNDHAAATIAGFVKGNPYDAAVRLLDRALMSGHGLTDTMASYVSENAPAFGFAMVAVVLAVAMLKS